MLTVSEKMVLCKFTELYSKFKKNLEVTILSVSILLVECKASISIYPELKVTNTIQNLCTSIF